MQMRVIFLTNQQGIIVGRCFAIGIECKVILSMLIVRDYVSYLSSFVTDYALLLKK